MRLPPSRVQRPRIIGLDPSLTHFAAVVMDLDCKVVSKQTLAPKTKGMQRIADIIDFVLACHSAEKVAPILVREDYAFSAHSGSDTMLKELGGALDYALFMKGIQLYRVSIAQVKKVITGKGNAQKDQMMLCVYKYFGFDPGDEHQADAFGVAITAQMLITRQTISAAQREVVDAAVASTHPLTVLTS